MDSKKYRTCRAVLVILCSIGISLSVYAYYVETKKESNSDYQAACDINEKISCSAVFTSKYGRGFGLLEHIIGEHHWLNQPNSVFGVLFYIVQLVLDSTRSGAASRLQITLSVIANFGSVYLACILVFVLHDICMICVSTYVVNFFVLVCNLVRRRHILPGQRMKNSSEGHKIKKN